MKQKVALILLLVLFVVGCGTWQKTSMISYEGLGIAKDNVRDLMQVKCRQPETTEEECEEMRLAYNEVTAAYVVLGDVAPILIEANDRKKYMEMRDKFIELLNVIQEFVGKEEIQ